MKAMDEIEDSQVSTQDEAEVELSKGFIPPSVSKRNELAEHPSLSYTYHSQLPKALLDNPGEPCILGVDEAGRGPVLGPMVYAAAYCPISYKETLSTLSFADSKTLTPQIRSNLLEQLCSPSSDQLHSSVGWSTRIMTATDISSGMLSPTPYNLNAQAHDTTIALIRQIISSGVNVQEIYVDTVGPESSYQTKLQYNFPGAKVTVTKKADSKFPIVSVASVCAKVTRDVFLGNEEIWGSGYPSDPRTSGWLKGYGMDKVFGWHTEEVRYSWATVRDLLEKAKDAVKVNWHEDESEYTISSYFMDTVKTPSSHWYGQTALDADF